MKAKDAVMTGIEALDRVMGGLRVGLTVVTGPERCSKDALAEQIVIRLVAAGMRVAVFSLFRAEDVVRDELLNRAKAQGLQTTQFCERLVVDGRPGLTVFEVSDALDAERPDVAYIANLNLLRSVHTRYRAEELRDVAACLRCLARDLDVPILALASHHAPDDMAVSDDGIPRYLLDWSTCVLLVSRPVYSHQAVTVAKNDGGATGAIDLLFDDSTDTYR